MSAPDLLDALTEKLPAPAAALRRQDELYADVRFILANRELWRTQYPNRFVAVHKGELVAVEPSREALMATITRKGWPISDVLFDYISEQPVALVL